MDQLAFVSALCGHVFCEGGEALVVKRASISAALIELSAGDWTDSPEVSDRVDVLLDRLDKAFARLNN